MRYRLLCYHDGLLQDIQGLTGGQIAVARLHAEKRISFNNRRHLWP